LTFGAELGSHTSNSPLVKLASKLLEHDRHLELFLSSLLSSLNPAPERRPMPRQAEGWGSELNVHISEGKAVASRAQQDASTNIHAETDKQ
jgi:hypothetical protein